MAPRGLHTNVCVCKHTIAVPLHITLVKFASQLTYGQVYKAFSLGTYTSHFPSDTPSFFYDLGIASTFLFLENKIKHIPRGSGTAALVKCPEGHRTTLRVWGNRNR